jgi:hypothetical protein
MMPPTSHVAGLRSTWMGFIVYAHPGLCFLAHRLFKLPGLEDLCEDYGQVSQVSHPR